MSTLDERFLRGDVCVHGLPVELCGTPPCDPHEPPIDKLAKAFWDASGNDREQTRIQYEAHGARYSLREWTSALQRQRDAS